MFQELCGSVDFKNHTVTCTSYYWCNQLVNPTEKETPVVVYVMDSKYVKNVATYET